MQIKFLKVGITGGIGSGKSLVCEIFKVLGTPVYHSDDRAKILMAEDAVIVEKIKSKFGKEAYYSDGSLNRELLSRAVFNDDQKRLEINSIVHPAVALDFDRWTNDHRSFPYVIKEAAILFENGSYTSNDLNILVVADEEERIRRVMARDSIDREAVVVRLNHQWPDNKKMPLADVIIENKTLEDVLVKVREIDRNIRNNRPF